MKKNVTMFLVMVLALSFTACGGENTQVQNDTPSDIESSYNGEIKVTEEIVNDTADDNSDTSLKTPDGVPVIGAQPIDNTEYESDDFLYVIYDDGTVEITKYIGNDTMVTIPSEIDDYPVGRIGTAAFENGSSIESFIVWAKLISIGESAFKGCSNLTEFSVPSTVTVINDSVFENCTSLETIIIWGDVTIIGEAAFKNCVALTDVSIPSSCMSIGKSAFEGCSAMESVIFWGGEVIGEKAFKDCVAITSISIPSEVIAIESSAFEGCSNLETVIIWGDDVSIGLNAFSNCPKLAELPEGAVNSTTESIVENENSEIKDEVAENVEAEDTNTVIDEITTESSTNEENADASNGMRPEFKEAMDSYEAFYDEYCEFMKKYQENPTDLSLLAEYADMVGKLAEMDEKFGEWEDKDLSDEELKYYMEVNTRVSQKMLEIL